MFGLKLKRISPSDLKSFSNLTYLNLSENKIKKIDENLFHNNPKLQYVDFSYNAISEVGPGLLKGLNVLTYFRIYSNICSGESSQLTLSSDNTLADVQRDLDFVCGPEGESSSNACLADCTARAAVLQTRVRAVTESIDAPWYYKLRLFFSAVFLLLKSFTRKCFYENM